METQWSNPVSVCVAIVPIKDTDGKTIGVLGCERIRPSGGLALIGGFQEGTDSLRDTAAKEVEQETGIKLNPAKFLYYGERMTQGKVPNKGHINLVFWRYDGHITLADVEAAVPQQDEIVRVVNLSLDEKLCFEFHQEMKDMWVERYCGSDTKIWLQRCVEANGIPPREVLTSLNDEEFTSLVRFTLTCLVEAKYYNPNATHTIQSVVQTFGFNGPCGCLGKQYAGDYGCGCAMSQGVMHHFGVIAKWMLDNDIESKTHEEIKLLIAEMTPKQKP